MNDSRHCTDPGVIQDALRRVLESRGFDASERNRQFLAYAVEETLEGRGDRIKAYSIATSVFGRDAGFDPQLDSIVRIEAGRLRRSLERYYLTTGAEDPIRITIPRGSYVPVFHVVGSVAEEPAPSPPPARKHGPDHHGRAIYVSPLDEDGDQSAFPNFTRGLTRQIVVGLTRFTDLFVFGADAAPGPDAAAGPGGNIDVDFVLTGGTTLTAERFCLEVLLSDARTGRYLWGESFERALSPAEILEVRDEVANNVVRTLAQPYGIIFGAKARETDGTPPASLHSFDGVVLFYQYWRSYDPDLFDPVRESLERAIQREPGYAEAHACLSLMFVNAFRFGIAVDGGDPRQRALTLAHQAITLAPNSSRGYHALSLAYWFSGDVPGSIEALETGLALNPNDTAIMADLGLRYALRADWDKAVPLLEGAYTRNPAQPGSYRTGLALYHYMHGRFAEALAEARRVEAPPILYGAVLTAIAAARLGLWQDAEEAIAALLAIDPEYGRHLFADLRSRNLHPDLIQAIADGLRLAGLTDVAAGEGEDTPASRRAMLRLARSARTSR
ncbi:tetratricopeptide repeat protein [Humitalea sp. 24SJ18S-53]|uniref:tetratricopeptide repeat protein n=1 Tax=Humitalea sp. 24SJ18S-53 TaxID=3422307 RepID=UPI003D664688